MAKRVWWIIGGIVVLLVLVVGVAPYAYVHFIREPADPELTLPSVTQAAVGEVDGNWTVGPGPASADARTQAGYRVQEVLRGEHVTVNGRTTTVTGAAQVRGQSLQSATITVDVASISTPESRRDSQFRSASIMDTGQFPTATFAVTEPVDLSGVPASGASATVDVAGTIMIKGVTKAVRVTMNVARSGPAVIVQGAIPVVFSDFGVAAPSLGFVTVEAQGSVEFLVNFIKA